MSRTRVVLAATLALATLLPTPGSAQGESLDCEIRVVARGGSVSIEPTVITDRAVRGDYRLVLTGSSGSGRTNVSQGGPFEAAPGATPLARTALSAGARADARLTVSVGGEAVTCTGRID